MAHFVFQVSDQSAYGKQRSAQEVFDFLVKEKSAWGFGKNTPNRKAIQPGDRVLFYLTGANNQTFVGAATLKTGAYENKSKESQEWYLDPETLRIDLQDIVLFPEPRPRKNFLNLEWRPAQGGSAKISEQDFLTILSGQVGSHVKGDENIEEIGEFALEKYLEEFIVSNWLKIDFGEKLELFEDENGNKGQQYYTGDVGYIDLLAKDHNGGFVVIELKKGRKNDEVVGQILRYMQWVRRNLCRNKESIRGMIVVGSRDIKLEHSVAEINDKVAVKVYRMSFKLEDY